MEFPNTGLNRCSCHLTALQAVFKSDTPFGWPQIVLVVMALDWLGHDIVIGYGALHLPIGPGRSALLACNATNSLPLPCSFTRRMPLFCPVESSPMQTLLTLFSGRRAEYTDLHTVAQSAGREGLLAVLCEAIYSRFVDLEPASTNKHGLSCSNRITRLRDFSVQHRREGHERDGFFGLFR